MHTLEAPKLAQQLAALSRGNEVRSAKARLKQRMRTGELSAVDALGEPFADRFRVEEWLLAIPQVGRWKVLCITNRCEVPPSKRVGALTDRQRGLLVEAVR